MREKDPSDAYVLGMYYENGRLYLFHRRHGRFLRYDNQKNQKGETSGVGDLMLHLPDPYAYLPSFDELMEQIHRPTTLDRTNRSVDDLEKISTIANEQIRDALSNVLRALDVYGLVNQRGYQILIQTLALKIFDEKRNERTGKPLEFYVTSEEAQFTGLADEPIQEFIRRMQSIRELARTEYSTILEPDVIDWKNAEHVRAVVAASDNFQDFSFVRLT